VSVAAAALHRLGVIGGHSLLGSAWGLDATRADVRAGSTTVTVFEGEHHVLLQRHGADHYTPAHLVDHVANLRALVTCGCDRVLALSSVGGLHPELGVGTILAPDDFVALDSTVTVHDDARGHIVPRFDSVWRPRVLAAVADAGVDVRDGGVYWQARGPRFETPAEIRFIAQFADVVGMTAASEAIVAQELGVPYAVVCVVDNLANGVGGDPLTYEEFEAGKRATRETVLAMLDHVVPVLAR